MHRTQRPPIFGFKASSKARHVDGFMLEVSHIAMGGRPCPMVNVPMGRIEVLRKHIVDSWTLSTNPDMTTEKTPATWLEQRTETSHPHFDLDIFIKGGSSRFSNKDYTGLLVKASRVIQETARACYAEEGSPYTPPDGVLVATAEPVDRDFRLVLATAKPKVLPRPEGAAATLPRDEEWKAHLYLPGLAMTSHQLRVLRVLAVERLHAAFAATQFHDIDWTSALDQAIYFQNGLRMLYCDKATRCPCRGAKSKACTACSDGLIYAGRVYTVTLCMDGNGRIDRREIARLSAGTSASIDAALQETGIRMQNAVITRGFRTPLGTPFVPPYTYVKRAASSAWGGTRPYVPLNRASLARVTDPTDWRLGFLTTAIRNYPLTTKTKDPYLPYAAIDTVVIYVATNGKYLRVDVLGANDSFCCNQGRQHNRCGRAYFLVRRDASTGRAGLTQSCSCRKPTTGRFGVGCKAYSARRYEGQRVSVFEKDWAMVLPAPPGTLTAAALFAMPGEEGEAEECGLADVEVTPEILALVAAREAAPVTTHGTVPARSVASSGRSSVKRRRDVAEGRGGCFIGDRSHPASDDMTIKSDSTGSVAQKRQFSAASTAAALGGASSTGFLGRVTSIAALGTSLNNLANRLSDAKGTEATPAGGGSPMDTGQAKPDTNYSIPLTKRARRAPPRQ